MRILICALVAMAAACQSTDPVAVSGQATAPIKPKVVVEFRLAGDKPGPNTVEFTMAGEGGKTYHVDPKPFLDGNSIEKSEAIRDQFGNYRISVVLDNEGAAIMGKVTEKNIRRQMAIIVDGKLVSVATIQSKIGSRGQITGKFTEAEATRIANGLNASR